MYNNNNSHFKAKDSRKRSFLNCGECGETYRRHQQYNKYKTYYIWVCKRHENTGKQNCSAKPLKEDAIEKAFVRAFERLIKRARQNARQADKHDCRRNYGRLWKRYKRDR
ncbi:MAG: zinc ribbon domain-containing protein [Clostridia bacterium]|nr:zinc ribbon domain-containing protein [Clostridia bacterium]